jgi:polysaccharide export outer membrane protein
MSRSMFFFKVVVMVTGLFFSLFTSAAPYLVNPGDVLQIDIWDEENLSGEVLVRPDGIISLPMAGEIDTTGSTPSQVGDKITQSLGRYMKDTPRLVVSLVNVDGNKIYVVGKVTTPGEFMITSDTDVMQALALAGGLTTFAAENDIVVLRRGSDGKQVGIPFPYAEVKAGKDLESNILLQSRDVVVVP